MCTIHTYNTIVCESARITIIMGLLTVTPIIFGSITFYIPAHTMSFCFKSFVNDSEMKRENTKKKERKTKQES